MCVKACVRANSDAPPLRTHSKHITVQGGQGEKPTAGQKAGWRVSEATLSEFVGKPVFTSDRLYEGAPPPGVAMGLAWTSLGGTSLYIEAFNPPTTTTTTTTLPLRPKRTLVRPPGFSLRLATPVSPRTHRLFMLSRSPRSLAPLRRGVLGPKRAGWATGRRMTTAKAEAAAG